MKVLKRETRNMGTADYHRLECPPYLNHSTIRYLAAEGSWRARHDVMFRPQQGDEEHTDAQRVGTIFHLAQETPEWMEWVVVVPSELEDDEWRLQVEDEFMDSKLTVSLDPGTTINLRSKAHKRYRDLHREAAIEAGKLWLSEAECQVVLSQVAACLENPVIRELTRRQLGREVVYLAETNSDIILKALVDVDCPEYILDWKTTRFNTPHSFVRDAYRKGYHYQAGHYLTVTGKDVFYFAAVTKSVPAEAMLYQVPPEVIETAKNENDKLYDAIAGCFAMESYHCPGWGTIMPLDTEGLPI